jgi:hypothetical protein
MECFPQFGHLFLPSSVEAGAPRSFWIKDTSALMSIDQERMSGAYHAAFGRINIPGGVAVTVVRQL